MSFVVSLQWQRGGVAAEGWAVETSSRRGDNLSTHVSVVQTVVFFLSSLSEWISLVFDGFF